MILFHFPFIKKRVGYVFIEYSFNTTLNMGYWGRMGGGALDIWLGKYAHDREG